MYKRQELANYAVVKDIKELGDVDVAILCTPTRSVEKYAKEYLAMGINTVDSFDIHTGIVDSVSYTHLDVYKRQVYNYALSGRKFRLSFLRRALPYAI